ncbi:MAG: glycosyltransferase family 4 protein [Candidatus Omnitrophica bacterium]|nr:glycosyltransferase family 4 protein [Candidatus Omnitrophota bacterium]
MKAVRALVKKALVLFNKAIFMASIIVGYLFFCKKRVTQTKMFCNVGFVVEEFFQQRLRGFGGFGKSVKNIVDYVNSNGSSFKMKVLLSKGLPISKLPAIRKNGKIDILFRAHTDSKFVLNFVKYLRLINLAKIDLFITIDYLPSYEYPLFASSSTPLLIWIHDPRGRAEWERFATIPLVLKFRGINKEKLVEASKERARSIARIMRLSRILRRKIIFATQAKCLVERAIGAYGLNQLNAYYLPNPIPLPQIKDITYSEKPSLCFLARLDLQKRPWIVFELAKRFKNVDFYIAGVTRQAEVINPIIKKYEMLKNLKFLGLADGVDKERLLRNCWGFINTSIHEGLPVSFLEAFSFGKCVISCQNPDGLAEKFGFYTGDILGEGVDSKSLDMFSERIEEFLSNKDKRIEKGRLGKEYVEKNHSFSNFESRFKEILSREEIGELNV